MANRADVPFQAKKNFLRKVATVLCLGTKDIREEEDLPPPYSEKVVVLEV